MSQEAVRALRRTLELVESSQSSLWANDEVETISRHLRAAISALETSLANGWGDEFLSLARAIDAFLHTSS